MRANWYRSLAVEVTLLVMLGTSLVFALVLARSYYSSLTIIQADAEKSLQNLASARATVLDRELRSVEAVTTTFASFLENARLDASTLDNLIRRNVQEHKEIFGSTVAFEPFAFQAGVKGYAPYYYRGADGVQFGNLATDSYDYFMQDWYYVPKELKTPAWSQPYLDEGGGNILMTTYSVPFFESSQTGRGEKLLGVVTADISLDSLTKHLLAVKVGETGYCFLISETGVFLAHPNKDFIMKESIFSLADQRNLPSLRSVGRLMLAKESGFEDMAEIVGKKTAFLGFARLPSTGWSLGVVYPRSELFAQVDRLYGTNAYFASIGLVMLLVVSLLLAGYITVPLRRMVHATQKVASGNLDLEVPAIRRHDEVGDLARAFAKMTIDLKNYIHELTETTAVKERIEGELGVAGSIQRSMLPSTFPAFPDRGEFDIYAIMHPAKEVGGDFYQFLLVDDNRLCIAIGDVSGKGVPAALLMAVTTSLIRIEAAEGTGPDEILSRLNKHLGQGNDTCMFVTVFCGILDLRTGELVYANGGHEPPFVVKPDRQVLPLRPPGGPIVGIMEDVDFPLESLILQPGDALFAYTDGVTEAFDANGQLYSRERLGNELLAACDRPVQGLVEATVKSVELFSEGTPQADDITIIAVKFNGGRPMKTGPLSVVK